MSRIMQDLEYFGLCGTHNENAYSPIAKFYIMHALPHLLSLKAFKAVYSFAPILQRLS